MVEVTIVEKPEFKVVGSKIWISGTDNELFGAFWEESHRDGLIDKLYQIRGNKPGTITNSIVFGVSCVEKDPSDRSFFFYIAAEAIEACTNCELDEYNIPASKWAIFRNTGEMPMTLVESEMFAFTQWLPNAPFVHANVPELEVYPVVPLENSSKVVEFWLPIQAK